MTVNQFDKQKITTLCEAHDVSLMILHGSHAKGTALPSSDIDIGVIFSDHIHADYHAVMKDLNLICGDRVDPAFLNQCESLIAYQVATHGRPIYEKEPGFFQRFQLAAIRRFQDEYKFRELERLYLKKYIEKHKGNRDD